MQTTFNQRRDNGIPVFKLYGETRDWPTPDLIHCETIALRSRQHNWIIKPHRHRDLVHLLCVQSGEALVHLDGRQSELSEPSLVLVPEMCIHGFAFSEDIDGQVITLAAPLTQRLREQMGPQRDALQHAGCYALGSDEDYVRTLVEAIGREYAGSDSGRDLALQSLIAALVIWVERQAVQEAGTAGTAPTPGGEYLTRFSMLVERSFKEHLSIDDYAARIGISPGHLNTVCRRLTGRTALQIVHERLVLEAKRNLIYTSMPINQVSDYLGFSEPAYFTRFFKRYVGVSPKAFRLRSSLV